MQSAEPALRIDRLRKAQLHGSEHGSNGLHMLWLV